MKKFIILALFLNLNAAYASEDIFFANIPPNITTFQAMAAVEKAAVRRKWTSTELPNNKLQVKLDHHGYRNLLIFSFAKSVISYTDLTTYDVSDDYDDSDEEWKRKPTPVRWVNNLKKDTNKYLQRYARSAPTKEKFSHEEMAAKLESLKEMYDKELITKSEYEAKKKEIMSRY